MSSCCLSGKIASGQPKGREQEVAGLSTYVAEPSDNLHATAKTVIFLTDIFGWTLQNIRLLADQYAEAGFMAYVPDVQEGDSLHPSFLETVEPPLPKKETMSATEKVATTVRTGATLGPWLVTHREAVTRPIIEGFINGVRLIPGTDKVGVIGFCWGGRYAITSGQKPFSGIEGKGVDAVMSCHPSLVAIPGDFESVSVPTTLALGDRDSLLGEKEVEQIKEVMEKKRKGELGERCESEVKVYKDQVHGFALRGDWSSEKDKKAMDQAAQQGIEWFEKYLQ